MTSTRRTTSLWTVAALVAFAFPFVYSDYAIYQVTLALVYAVAVLGLVLLTGFSGVISVGHGAIFGIGAYACALSMGKLGVPYPVGIVVAAAIGFLVGLVLGLPALRIRGVYLALMTLGLALVFPPLLLRFKDLTGGSNGYSIPVPEAPFGLQLTSSQWMYVVSAVVVGGALLALANLRRSRVGRGLFAVRDSEPLGAAMGIDRRRSQLTAFATSGLYAGVGGALYVLVSGSISPDAFTFFFSVNLLVAALVGGINSPTGALLGAGVITLVPAATSTYSAAVPPFVFAAAILLVMYLRPGGLASLPRGIADLWVRLRSSRSTPVPAHPSAAAGDPPATQPLLEEGRL